MSRRSNPLTETYTLRLNVPREVYDRWNQYAAEVRSKFVLTREAGRPLPSWRVLEILLEEHYQTANDWRISY